MSEIVLAIVVLFGLLPIVSFIAIYPIFLWLASRWPNQLIEGDDYSPAVSIVVVASAPPKAAVSKIENITGLDYPPELVEILFYLDGEQSDTAVALRNLGDQRLKLIESPRRLGKYAGLNEAVKQARGEVLLFTDVDARLEPSALHFLLRHFVDPDVGGVVGRRVIEADDKTAISQRDYIHFDSSLKILESKSGSVTSNDGKIFAIRRELYNDVPQGVTDDAWIARGVIVHGRRFLFEPRALAYIPRPARDAAHEIERRRRIVSSSINGLWKQRDLFKVRSFGRFALNLWLNKVMRRLVPVGLVWLFLGSIALTWMTPLGWLLLGPQLLFYGVAALHTCVSLGRVGDVIYYFVLGNVGTLLGLIDFLRGSIPSQWESRKPRDPSRPHIAYMMSRFPKITETFVLYELLEIQRFGADIVIFPLLIEREQVSHPDVVTLSDRVHYAPFLNFPVLGANLCWLIRSPHRYVAAIWEALRGNWGSANLFIGALGILPKSMLYARKMQLMGVSHVHAHFATHPALAALIVYRMTNIPFSFTAHGHDVHIDLRMFEHKARLARFWVTISRYNERLLADAFGESINDNEYLIHCGVDTTIFRPSPPTPCQGPFMILCVASFKEVKGHVYLIEACRQLQMAGIEFRCHLVGDGPLRRQIKSGVVVAGLADFFIFHGQQPRPRVIELIRSCHVVVLPSILASRGDREGIPVSLMEGMAMERPVVASDLSGIPELVTSGREGLLVPPRDSVALGDALAKLALDPELRERMGISGREKVLREFDLRVSSARLAALLISSSLDEWPPTSAVEQR